MTDPQPQTAPSPAAAFDERDLKLHLIVFIAAGAFAFAGMASFVFGGQMMLLEARGLLETIAFIDMVGGALAIGGSIFVAKGQVWAVIAGLVLTIVLTITLLLPFPLFMLLSAMNVLAGFGCVASLALLGISIPFTMKTARARKKFMEV